MAWRWKFFLRNKFSSIRFYLENDVFCENAHQQSENLIYIFMSLIVLFLWKLRKSTPLVLFWQKIRESDGFTKEITE